MPRGKGQVRPRKNIPAKEQSQDAATSDAEDPVSETAAASAAAEFFKTVNTSVEKRTRAKRQKLEDRHEASVQKLEKTVREVSHTNDAKLVEYQKRQLGRLAELIKRRVEVEARIVAGVQELENLYETMHKEMWEVLKEKVAMSG